MSYNTTRYLSFLSRVEALTAAQRATIDDANPLAAFAEGAPTNWVHAPSSGGTAYETAYWNLVTGLLDFLPAKLSGQLTAAQRAVIDVIEKNVGRLIALGDPPRVLFGLLRASGAALLADFEGRGTHATTVYAPLEALVPFASL